MLARSNRLNPCSMMKKIIVSVVLGLLVGAAQASVLDGTWRIDLVRRGGVTLHTFLVLRQTTGGLDGKVVINGAVDLPLRKPVRAGADAAFSTDWNTDYRLHAEGGKLKVTIIYGGKEREEATAVRVPETEAHPPAVSPLSAPADAPVNGLALTPPMGWNSWNHFGDRVDDQVVRETADMLVSSGLAAAGYTYVNIDDSWEGERDAQGNITANTKFPDMTALAAYVHGRGLKLGLYSSPGPRTCGGYLGSYGHEEQDAKTYAAWGIDYLKYDWCSAARVYPDGDLLAAYQKMGRALAGCGRPIIYSLCEYGTAEVWTWGTKAGGNLWRTTGDIQDNWKSMAEIGFNQSRLAPFAGPGHWNDPDMLEVGNGGMSATESRTHFSLWCLLAAPLMAGNDLRHMSVETLAILGNREVIAVDQDALGRQGERRASRDGVELWIKPLHDGSRAIGVFNRTETERPARFTWTELGLSARPQALRDLWEHRDMEVAADGVSGRVPTHGVMLLIAK
jgi:alpha-galactosidase